MSSSLSVYARGDANWGDKSREGTDVRSKGPRNGDGYENVDDVEQILAGASSITAPPPVDDSTGGSCWQHHGNIPPTVSTNSSWNFSSPEWEK